MTNAQKTPLVRTMPLFVDSRIRSLISQRGSALPGHVVAVDGAIVTVNFDVNGLNLPQVDMPVFGPIYARYPIQIGDLGATFPIDVYLGGVSGLGIGTADLTQQGNLSALVWLPVGNKDWPAVDDPNSFLLQGPNGVVLQDMQGQTVSTLTPSGIDMDTPSVIAEQNLSVGNGWTGTFTDLTGQVITVQSGIITGAM